MQIFHFLIEEHAHTRSRGYIEILVHYILCTRARARVRSLSLSLSPPSSPSRKKESGCISSVANQISTIYLSHAHVYRSGGLPCQNRSFSNFEILRSMNFCTRSSTRFVHVTDLTNANTQPWLHSNASKFCFRYTLWKIPVCV